MKLRINHRQAEPKAYQAMLKLESYVHDSGLEPKLVEYIKIRASQLNGCAFCLDMHTTDLRKMGESEQKMHLIAAWRETPWFTPEERAALALTEAVTRIGEAGVPDALYEEVRQHFDEQQYAALIMAIITINGWNRIAISTGMFPGCFEA
ncbi:carboxymuconolactone decarboxylase family protein [Paenibacillus filicis]|uniref:Carboxymuconolactone decarboxylase family protein n=1 Tax=Paenibacillus gyeongsangnamensis TaxID=3388067 RepID=A0ABT4QHJ5_9BACL|nr:carboxymuconolactone decarboxylase family protein [Paenibacillus filicis]MCZ8516361.1 carboxymuconolactone decarboxylase family protein [Paenibacillus filicis]